MNIKLPSNFMSQAADILSQDIEITFEEMQRHCGSPIEAIFATAFVISGKLGYGEVGFLRPTHETASLPQFEWLLAAQRQIGPFRVDFVASANPVRPTCSVVIECDGHEFHERTKEQAAKDRARDRSLQRSGLKVFRFTGSEIHLDPFKCAKEVFEDLWCQLGVEDFRRDERDGKLPS